MDAQLLELGILGSFVLASFKYLIDDKKARELKADEKEETREQERKVAYTRIFENLQESHKDDREDFKNAISTMQSQNFQIVEQLTKNNQEQTKTLNSLNNSLVQISTQITSLNKKSNDLEKDLQDIKQIVAIKDKLKDFNN